MNTNVNNSVNANNSNINAMNANNLEFVCSRCGSKHIIAQPKCEEELPQFTEVGDTLFIKGGVTEMLIDKENKVSQVLARNLDQLPEELLVALRNVGAYDLLFGVASDIEEEGYIRNSKIVKRFLVSKDLWLVEHDQMANFLSQGGFRYALRVMENQLNLMAHMEKNKDTEALKECSMIWTDKVFIDAMEHWSLDLEVARAKKYRIHRCKGRKYVKISHSDFNGGKGIFLDEWPEFMRRFRKIAGEFTDAENYDEKHYIFTRFSRECKKMRWTASQCDAFDNAFRAAGGYYTLKSLILFDGVKICDDPMADQLELLKQAYGYRCGEKGKCVTTDGYKMFGFLKAILKKNNFDFEATRKRWYEASEARKEARRNHKRRSRN